MGIFDLLDEESKLPAPKFDHFTMEVHNRNKNHFRLSVSYLQAPKYHFFQMNTVCRYRTNFSISR